MLVMGRDQKSVPQVCAVVGEASVATATALSIRRATYSPIQTLFTCILIREAIQLE